MTYAPRVRKHVGILTSGGDCPGLNAAIRGFGKAAIQRFGMDVLGFLDGFRGIVRDRTRKLEVPALSGILTDGGTILGTSRDKPHKMPVGGKLRDMTDAVVETYAKHGLDCLVCLGGGGTQKNALRLAKAGLNVVTLPKTIDNDVARTDVTFGFDTAMQTGAEAIDRLHSTATSHNRVIVVELMGHRAGWLTLGAGLAGGADVILIPEIPYDLEKVADAIRARGRAGKHFSIVAVAEGATSRQQHETVQALLKEKEKAESKDAKRRVSAKLEAFHARHTDHTLQLTQRLEERTGQESRLTILGHLVRGGTPSAADRVLSTRLGTAAAELVEAGHYGVMAAVRGDGIEPVPLEEVAGRKKLVPPHHPWVNAARLVDTSFGD
jgi:6-phosphofructokinase 1